ncbi:MAG: translation initiation factor IF-2 N-terminal domain-containing protein [Faecalibacterium sp.]
MTVKYKVSDFAKDLNLSAKKVLDELAAMGSTGKKNSSNLEENELNYLLEKFSKDSSVTNLDEFLNSAKAPKEEPKPAEKKAGEAKRLKRSPKLPRPRKSPQQPAAKKPEQKAQPLPSRTNRQRPATSTATRRTSSTRSVRKRPFPSASWLVRPVPRHPLPRHRLCRCAARTIR